MRGRALRFGSRLGGSRARPRGCTLRRWTCLSSRCCSLWRRCALRRGRSLGRSRARLRRRPLWHGPCLLLWGSALRRCTALRSRSLRRGTCLRRMRLGPWHRARHCLRRRTLTRGTCVCLGRRARHSLPRRLRTALSGLRTALVDLRTPCHRRPVLRPVVIAHVHRVRRPRRGVAHGAMVGGTHGDPVPPRADAVPSSMMMRRPGPA